MTGAINTLKGPLEIDCVDGGKCNFKQTFLNALFGQDGLELSSCTHGECVQQYVIDQALGIETAAATTSSLSGGVIAGLAVVAAILVAIIAVAIGAWVMRRKARKHMRTDGVMPKSGGVGVVWSGVGYEVQHTGHHWGARAFAWLKGSGKTRHHESGSVGPNGGKIVLRECCGALPAGGFCAVLGPSGSGKSTLVDILAGKRKSGKVEGRVSYLKEGNERVKIGYSDQVSRFLCGSTESYLD